MSVHDVAASGFGAEADAYERARPSYPPDAVAWLVATPCGLRAGARICDLAAGTGKFTRLLVPHLAGAELLAVEPVEGMRTLLSRSLPDVPVAAATAEALPFVDGSLAGIAVAQAFHWFDARAALAEFHRVLQPGGRLALVWNARDRSVPWVDELWSIMDRVEKRAPWRAHDEWRESAFVDTPWFTPLTEATFHHEQVVTPDDVVERVRSVSHVAVLATRPAGGGARRGADAAAQRSRPPSAAKQLAIPYRVDAYWAERI